MGCTNKYMRVDTRAICINLTPHILLVHNVYKISDKLRTIKSLHALNLQYYLQVLSGIHHSWYSSSISITLNKTLVLDINAYIIYIQFLLCLQERSVVLRKWFNLIIENQDELAKLLTTEMVCTMQTTHLIINYIFKQ